MRWQLLINKFDEQRDEEKGRRGEGEKRRWGEGVKG
jgi:hypothetical protein